MLKCFIRNLMFFSVYIIIHNKSFICGSIDEQITYTICDPAVNHMYIYDMCIF